MLSSLFSELGIHRGTLNSKEKWVSDPKNPSESSLFKSKKSFIFLAAGRNPWKGPFGGTQVAAGFSMGKESLWNPGWNGLPARNRTQPLGDESGDIPYDKKEKRHINKKRCDFVTSFLLFDRPYVVKT